MRKRITMVVVVMLVAVCGFGFILTPHPNKYQVDVTTRIELIGGHQYAMAVATTVDAEGSKTAITMVHHAGCSACSGDNRKPIPTRRRPPIALPYLGQF